MGATAHPVSETSTTLRFLEPFLLFTGFMHLCNHKFRLQR
uniref:Uncharacterized protein n=1 Tax=Arundo donax TaxID=35708 RepID=A0A0A9C3S4_ARUDO